MVRYSAFSFRNQENSLRESLRMYDVSGHRQRLRERFLAVGRDAVSEHELLEMLLFYSIPRKDVKPLAKDLLNNCGSLKDVFLADKEKLLSVKGTGEATVALLKLVKVLSDELTATSPDERALLNSRDKLYDYVCRSCRNSRMEALSVLLLDRNSRLLKKVEFSGKKSLINAAGLDLLSKTACYVRAKKIVIIHNHPSETLLPSTVDVNSTIQVKKLFAGMGIFLADHLIVSGKSCVSLMKLPGRSFR